MGKIDTTELLEKIEKTKGLIMAAKQDLFYLEPHLRSLEFDLENINLINARQENL